MLKGSFVSPKCSMYTPDRLLSGFGERQLHPEGRFGREPGAARWTIGILFSNLTGFKPIFQTRWKDAAGF
jgi:hypothetical protein